MYWSSSCKTWPTTKTDILMLYNYYLAGTGNISRHHYIWINCIFFVIMVFPEVNYHCTDLPSRLNGYSHRKPVASPNQNELKKVPGSCVAVYVYAIFWFFTLSHFPVRRACVPCERILDLLSSPPASPHPLRTHWAKSAFLDFKGFFLDLSKKIL